MPRRAPRRDNNESEIVRALRAVGASVQALDAAGVPDLLVGFRGANYLLEVKSARGKLTKEQERWHLLWRGQLAVVWTVAEAFGVLGVEVER